MAVAKNIYSILIRLVVALAVLGVLAYMVIRAIVPTGFLSVTTDLVNPAPFVSEPKPSVRLDEPAEAPDGTMVSALLDEPLYLDLTPPSDFDSVTLSLRYLNHGHQVIEVSALGSSLDQQFLLQPAENMLIDSLPWRRVKSGELTLLQRDNDFASIDEFLREPPERSRVAVYRAYTPIPFRMEDYGPLRESRRIEVSLRGHHRILTYVEDEPLAFSFSVQDMNRQDGADPVIVSVFRDGSTEAVTRAILEDDGNTSDDQVSSGLRTVSVGLTEASAGLYQVEFTAPGDVFIRSIDTPQRKVVFADRIFLGDHVGYSDRSDPVIVLVSGNRLVARTPHVEGLQKLEVAGQEITLTAPHIRHIIDIDSKFRTAPVTSPELDVLFETDGVFALSSADFFDPSPLEIAWYTAKRDLADLGIDYILTTYDPPTKDGDYSVAKVTFDMADLALTEDGAYRFAISAPGITETMEGIQLAEVTFTMRRAPVTSANLLSRLVGMFSGRAPADSGQTVLPAGESYGERIE